MPRQIGFEGGAVSLHIAVPGKHLIAIRRRDESQVGVGRIGGYNRTNLLCFRAHGTLLDSS